MLTLVLARLALRRRLTSPAQSRRLSAFSRELSSVTAVRSSLSTSRSQLACMLPNVTALLLKYESFAI